MLPSPARHQYIDRHTAQVRTETLYGDRLVNAIYSTSREHMPSLFRALTSARASSLLGFLNYDLFLGERLTGARRLLQTLGIDLSECCDPPEHLNTPRRVFERRIRYWDCRPLPADAHTVVSPADAKILPGALSDGALFFIKEKFFHLHELLGADKSHWHQRFSDGEVAIFRLTPEKYHYNHVPVSGLVRDIYPIDGCYHSCNPGAVVQAVTPYSKNKRVVTVIDTDVAGGTGVGLVAMIEVVALMIGDIVQCYSRQRYDTPQSISAGMFLERGQPKSLYRPGSSVDVLLFERNRVHFAPDLVANARHASAQSRYSQSFGQPLVETDVWVRSAIATRRNI